MLTRGSKGSSYLPSRESESDTTKSAAFLVGWFLAALALSESGWTDRFSAAQLLIGGFAIPAGIFIALWVVSERFRRFAQTRDLKWITRGQSLRFYGGLALIRFAQGILPGRFAVPTGISDLFFAATSLVVASRLISPEGLPRRGFEAWHVLGILAAMVSGSLGVLTSPSGLGVLAGRTSSGAMSYFPQSLVPLFFGPAVLILHLIALATAWRQKRSASTP